MAQLLDAIVDDTFIIAKHPLRPDSDHYNTYALERRVAPIGPAREHVIGVLAALQENLKSQRSDATTYERMLTHTRAEITALETLTERMTQRLEALLQAQQQERQQKVVTAGQRKIVLDRPKRTPVA